MRKQVYSKPDQRKTFTLHRWSTFGKECILFSCWNPLKKLSPASALWCNA